MTVATTALPARGRFAGAAAGARSGLVYLLVSVVGVGAFLYPFWLPAHAVPDTSHASDAPFVAALVGLGVVAAVLLELQRGTMTGATVAMLGVLSAMAGLLRVLDLPSGGNAMFFLVLLVGAAFGPRFGLLLGMLGMVVGAITTGGFGPWLPFQMLAMGWLGALAGATGRLTRRLPPLAEVLVLAVMAWAAGMLYGAVMNLTFWPFVVDGGPTSWEPGLAVGEALVRYWRFYVATSLAWDSAGAVANAVVVALVGRPVLATLRRFSHRLEPVVELV